MSVRLTILGPANAAKLMASRLAAVLPFLRAIQSSSQLALPNDKRDPASDGLVWLSLSGSSASHHARY